MINIAVDVAVGRKHQFKLQEMGYNVVCWARNAEPDEEWLNRAFASDALFVLSPDMDIPKIIEKEGYPMLWVGWPLHDPRWKETPVTHVDMVMKFKIDFFKMVVERHGDELKR